MSVCFQKDEREPYETAPVDASHSLNVACYLHTATLLSNGQVLVVGGNSTGPSGYTASAEVYTP